VTFVPVVSTSGISFSVWIELSFISISLLGQRLGEAVDKKKKEDICQKAPLFHQTAPGKNL
jgi:hypothetical protein